MALSIRNPKAERLVREIAAESGENLTQAIIHAPEDRLESLKGRRAAADIIQEIMRISMRCKVLPDRDLRTADEILGYDERGLPTNGH
jgi:antitoxin VapB